MTSLREKVAAEKAAKAEENIKLRQQEHASAEAQEKAALSAKFDKLVEDRASITDIKKRAAETKTGLASSKGAVRNERANLRDIHEQSIDESTGEASLPKWNELIKDNEFKDADEVQAYGAAREQFRLSVAEARKVKKELVQLGIEDPSKLLPGQLEAILEERERELESETRSFVLEHPDVNPEMAAQVREELIASRTAVLESVLNKTESASHRSFYSALTHELERAKDSSHSTERTYNNALFNAVAIALDPVTGEKGTSAAKQRTMDALQRAFKDVKGPLTDMDSEAVTRALLDDFIEGAARSYAVPRTDTALTRFLNESAAAKAAAAGETAPERLKNPDSLSSDALDSEYEAMRAERREAMKQAIRGNEFVERRLQTEVRNIMTTYEKFKEHSDIPGQVRELTNRQEQISKSLKGVDAHGNRVRDALPEKLEALESAQGRFDTQIHDLGRKKSETLEMLQIASALSLGLQQSVLDAPITIKPYRGGEFDAAKIEGVWNVDELGALGLTMRTASGQKEELEEKVDRLQQASRKKGLLGMKSKEQKEAEEKLLGKLDALFPEESAEVTPGTVLDAATQKISELETTIADAKLETDTIHRNADALKRALKPIDKTIRLFGTDGFTGTVREYIPALRERIHAEVTRIEQEIADLTTKKGESQTERIALLEQKRALEKEQEEITQSLQSLKQTQERLDAELKKKGYLPA